MGLILHHYTTEAGLAAILKSKTILPSLKANNIKDARFGDGQYLSDVPPGSKRPGQLSSLFFKTPWAGRRFAYYVSIDTAGLNPVYGRPGVWVVLNSKPLDISKRLVGSGKN